MLSFKAEAFRSRVLLRTGAVAGALVLAAGLVSAAGTFASGSINIVETGSTLLYPLFNLWVPAYTWVMHSA